MKRQRQKLFRVVLAGVLMIFSFMVYAQERIVTGKVYDSSGESIIGASVMVQGTMQGVVTDIDGAFQLKVQPSQSLVISFLGYQDVILPVGSKNNFKIILEEDSKKLDEVRIWLGALNERYSEESEFDRICCFRISKRYSRYSGG